VVIPPPEMVEGDADLQDALVQQPHVAPLGPPEQLQRFVLLEVLAAIELRDALQELGWRSLVACSHVISDLNDRALCGPP
jgi:hypothetical protein